MMITRTLKKASILVVAFFLFACSSLPEASTVPSVEQVVADASCDTVPLRDVLKQIKDVGGVVAHEFVGAQALVLVGVHAQIIGATEFKGDTFLVVRKGEDGAVIVSYKGCVQDIVFAPYADIMTVVEAALRDRPA
jgi:hypothetical protein